MQHPLGVGGTKSILHRCLTEQNADPGLHAPGSVGSFLNPKSSIRDLLLESSNSFVILLGVQQLPTVQNFLFRKKLFEFRLTYRVFHGQIQSSTQ